MIITLRNWQQFAHDVSYPSRPDEYNQAAVDRLMDKMDGYITRVKGVRPQFRANNNVRVIPFSTQEGRDFYEQAMERFQARKAKAQKAQAMGYSARAEMLVALLQFRIGAESNPDRVRYVAQNMWETVNKRNKAAACAFNFRISTSKVIYTLMNDFNVPRSDISVIWGGSSVNNSDKKKAKKTILDNEELLLAMKAQGISLEDLNLGDDVVELSEEVTFNPEDRLGSQNLKQRQEEIDRYQRGESKYVFFTFKAGGVGLSLHHTDEYVEPKCRRKKSGYAVEEDIIHVPTKPRELYCAPTYSAIELVQGLGRCPRLTSLSDTEQYLIFFAGTIEERVAAITKMKLRCLSKVVRQREDWMDIVSKEEAAINEELFKAEEEAKANPDGEDAMLISENAVESDEE